MTAINIQCVPTPALVYTSAVTPPANAVEDDPNANIITDENQNPVLSE